MEGVPKESETIVVKRSERVRQKIINARKSLFSKRQWWSGLPMEFVGVFLILTLNFLVLLHFFGTVTASMTFSGPVLPFFTKIFSVFDIPFSYSVQMLYLILMMAFPISFYFFVKRVSHRKFSAFISTLLVSTPIYPFLLIRVKSGLLGSEGSFISSLPFIFVSLIALLNFLRAGEIKNLIFVSLSSAFVALVSPFGFFCYVIMALVTTFSEILLGEGRLKFFRFLTTLFFAGTLCSFWYTPPFFYWMIFGEMGLEIRELIKKIVPISLFAVPIFATLGYLLFDRKPQLQPLFLATFYTVVFSIFALMGEGFAPGNTGRYLHLFGISLGFLIGIASLNLLESFVAIPLVRNLILTSICLFLITFTIVVRDGIYKNYESVLGAWADVEKGDIWVARDGFISKYSLSGYLITFLGITGLTYLYKSQKMP